MVTIKKHFPKLLSAIFLLLILMNISIVLINNIGKYTNFDYWSRYGSLKQTYLDSQYVNKHPKGWIPDEVVNAYAGGAYVKGVSPILIAPDTPPLGRYIIGLSTILFNNENILPLGISLGCLVLLYLLGMQIFSRTWLALLTPLCISFEPIFTNQLVYTPLLDTMQLFFLLCSFYFFNKAVMGKKAVLIYFTCTNIALGLFIATKFYVTGITVIVACALALLFLKEFRKAVLYFATLPVAIIMLLLSYVRVLFDHYTLFKFLGIQKYVFLYHKSQLIYPFSVWALLLFNKWYVWFGKQQVLSDAQWRLTWPLTTMMTFITGVLMLIRKMPISAPVLPLSLWVVCYLLFFSVGQITTRYFVILLPVLYLVAFYGLSNLISFYLIKKRIHEHRD